MPTNLTPIIELKHATKVIENGEESKVILDDVSLQIHATDFITILGGNGAGKSTLFNAISGTLSLTSGTIWINGVDVTKQSPEKRAAHISRVFQDPKMGTAPRMTGVENLAIASLRGKKRTLKLRQINQYKSDFTSLAAQIGNGLEAHLDVPTGNLSGGQRKLHHRSGGQNAPGRCNGTTAHRTFERETINKLGRVAGCSHSPHHFAVMTEGVSL